MDNSNSGSYGVTLATCPVCGESLSETRRHDGQPERVPQTIIVADNRAHLHELFQQAFAYHETVRVLVDRRVAERRGRSGPYATDRRGSDRRSPATIDGLLHSIGWAIVPPGCPGAASGLCPLVLSGAGPGTSLVAVGPPSPTGDPRSSVSRHLLGIGALLLTMIPGYVASRTAGAHETPHVIHAETPHMIQAAAGPQEQIEPTPTGMDIGALIRAVATRYDLSVDLVAAVIEAESDFNPRAVSRKGARGLMQLMPKTAAILGVGDPFDPLENIEGGVRHLRSLMDRFDGNLPLVLAAYNAGERAVIGHGGIPPYRETRQYVNRILRRLDREGDKTSDAGRRGRKA